MTLLDLCRQYDDGRLGRIVGVAMGGGFLGALTVAVSNLASAADRSAGSVTLGLAFIGALAIMFLCNRWSARAAVDVFEALQFDLRRRLERGLRSAPLRTVETLDTERGRAIGDLTFISTTITQIVTLIQSLTFLISLTVVIGFISGKALLIWLGTCGALVWWMRPRLERLQALQAAQSGQGGDYHASVEALVRGFKQLKLDGRASDSVLADIRAASGSVFGGRVELTRTSDQTYLGGAGVFYIVGFGLATFAPESGIGLGPVLGFEMLILLALALGSLLGVLQAFPVAVQAEAAATAVVGTLDRLEATADAAPGDGSGGFESIRLDGVRFAYGPDSQAFTVGPIDIELKRGTLVFVTGGNGSGKTTLMKMVMGLYPTAGRIEWDGQAVRAKKLSAYRGLFTGLFGDPHLFDRLYGIEASRERIESLLDRFGIADAVAFDGEVFGHLDLSSGQRMRLAMVVALLEDRPICVFDEWTANQDPETTWMYYETLLPELVRAGRTVIAVSHDDRFFDRADHLIRLDGGRVVIDRRQDTGPG